MGSDPINVGGTPEQKAKWFQKIAHENKLVAYGATEADAGSDLVSLRTRADRVEKDGKIVGYKITGSKMWISNGGVADIYTVLALAPGGPSWFIVEKGTPGFTQDAHEDKHGIRLSNTAGLAFDEVYVPAENLIGLEEGKGFLQAQAVFGYTRLMVAAFGLGGGEEAVETALIYAQQRIQAGGPLSEKQGFMLKLITPHYVRFEAARAYIDWTAKQLEINNHGLATEGAIAKLYATESGNKAAEDAIQAMGGFGYTKEFAVEKIKRDVKITCIYEGTSEVLEMTIFRGRWQEHLKSRGQYYIKQAEEFEALHTQHPDVGADSVALGFRALARVLEDCRAQKLTRHQYITFMLGDLISEAEVAAVFARQCAEGKVTEGCGCVYIGPERLVFRRRDGNLTPALEAYAHELYERIGLLKAQTDLVPYKGERRDMSDSELEQWCRDLKARLDYVKDAGFSPKMPSSYRFPPSRYEISTYRQDYEDLAYSISEYVDAHMALAESVSVYKDIVNNIFINKTIEILGNGKLIVNMDNGTALQLGRLSSGEKQILIMFYILLFHAEPGSVVILDEPEISLHVSWQHRLAPYFCDICRVRNIQMIVATHSPQVSTTSGTSQRS